MSKINNLRKYFIFFFIFAQDSNIPLGKVRSKFLAYIPTIMPISVVIFFFRTNFEHSARSVYLSKAGNSTLLIVSIIFIIPIVFVMYENWTNRESIPHIFRELLITKRFIENKMKIPFNQTRFESVFLWKLAAILLSTFLQFVVRIFIRSAFFPLFSEFPYILIVLIKYIAVTHIVFYMDFVKSIFNSINLHFDAMANNMAGKLPVLHSKTIISNFYDLKYVHYKMMRIISGLNSRFGWTLLSLSLDAFLSLTNHVYWIFSYRIMYPENGLIIMRNYIILFIYFDIYFDCKYLF